VAAADVAAVIEAVRAARVRLRERWPGLTSETLRRPGDTDSLVTLMEVYDFADAAHADELEAEAAAVVAPWLRGERHVERFEPLD